MYFEISTEPPSLAAAATTRGLWRWTLRGQNHEILATGEGYHTKQDCLNAITALQNTTVTTPVKEA